ncbi:peptide chain release factor 2 [Alphaproteobacteria bacterium]|nr:peptide chain release factor 2 [Alphaproteobacteria bacterium]GHS95921.1 peptide chain release factor 2 [Alphaproteobacteria bacterium]
MCTAVSLEEKENLLKELDRQAEEENLWEDAQNAQSLLKKRASLQNVVTQVLDYKKKFQDVVAFLELAKEDQDQAFYNECVENLQTLKKDVEKAQILSLLAGPTDMNNCFLEINSGAGGTEAQDWVSMLARMYARWAEHRHFSLEIMDETPGEEAGMKSISLKISGPYAYGWLKKENGVHRLVRISPFDANARRHTSFASVFVYPETDESIDIVIEEKDLKVDTYRASGAGGQHINKTDSAIRLTHIPTGVIVQCQVDRSQHRNRATAMGMLKARLYEIEMRKKQVEKDKAENEKMDIAWGSQIRSYVLQPYQLVKDARTNVEVGNAQAVLDGHIDEFLEAALAQGPEE